MVISAHVLSMWHFKVHQVGFQLFVSVYRPGLDRFAGRINKAKVEGLSWGVCYAQTLSDIYCLFTKATADEFVLGWIVHCLSPRVVVRTA